MCEFVTLGETMVSMVPQREESLQYGGELRMRIAGAESNAATGMQRLGHSSMFISKVGDDPFGQFIVRSIRAEGVDCSHVDIDPGHPTGIMFKDLLPGGETAVHYYRAGSAAANMVPGDLPAEAIADASLLHLTGITPVLSTSCRHTVLAALDIALETGTQVSFDPNIRKKLWKNTDYSPLMREIAARSDFLLLGADEARVLYGVDEVEKICSAAFKNSRTKLIAVKAGSRGAWVCSRDEIIFIPPYPCRCIDPVGAGDGFNSGFLSGVLEDKSLEECGRMGGISGAKATETRGDVEGLLTARQMQHILSNAETVYR